MVTGAISIGCSFSVEAGFSVARKPGIAAAQGKSSAIATLRKMRVDGPGRKAGRMREGQAVRERDFAGGEEESCTVCARMTTR